MTDITANDKDAIHRGFPLGSYVTVAAMIWTALMSVSLAWELYVQERATKEVARTQARAGFEKDVLYRRWNAMHGGVYAPVTEKTKPNPHLDVPERDIETPSGRKLTLVNAAYMTRQVHELGVQTDGVQGHITSLNPIRQENAADPWETIALEALQRGEPEHSSIEIFRGEPHLRLMRPLVTEKGCLKCHAAQGYQLGDIRGAISVSVPMEPLRAIGHATMISIAMWHGAILLLGLGGIGLSYQHLRARIRERDRAEIERDRLQSELMDASRKAGMAETATNVLHNVGNVLNSVNTTVQILRERTHSSHAEDLVQAAQLLHENRDDIVSFLTLHERGKHFPEFLQAVSEALWTDCEFSLQELDALAHNVEHIETIVRAQQSYSRMGNLPVSLRLGQLLDQTVETFNHNLAESQITVHREYSDEMAITTDKHRLLQILINLVANAQHALEAANRGDKCLTLRIDTSEQHVVQIEVIDNGIGIREEDLDKLFQHGFTTKEDGHGFGLHSSALAAKELGGTLTVASDGINHGATCTLQLPISIARNVSRSSLTTCSKAYVPLEPPALTHQPQHSGTGG